MSDERDVEEALARYVRSTDRRDGAEQGSLFTDDAVTQIYSKLGPDDYREVGAPLIGGAAVKFAVDEYTAPHPDGGSSHHTTSNAIISVDGDTAHYNAQFIVFEVRSPGPDRVSDLSGVQGTVSSTESGYYDSDLRKLDGAWRIVHHRVLLDTQMVLPTS